MKITDYLEKTAQLFKQNELCFGHGTDNARDEAVYLVFCSLNIAFEAESSVLERELDSSELALLDDRVTRRMSANIPVAYLVGKAWFAGHEFLCDNRALVPRSPIAELIQQRFEPLMKHDPLKILDLCAGGGCIGIACALEFTHSQVDLADLSADALALARENCRRHQLTDRVRVYQSDLFEQIDQHYDLIVSNPPYVGQQEVDSLPKEYSHEPELGLLSDDVGLAVPLEILRQAPEYLTEDGVLVMEVGSSSEALARRLGEVPLLWLEFAHGGDGVFSLTRQQLLEYSAHFN